MLLNRASQTVEPKVFPPPKVPVNFDPVHRFPAASKTGTVFAKDMLNITYLLANKSFRQSNHMFCTSF